MNNTRQIEMDFKPGLTRQYRNILDVVRTVVYRYPKGLDAVASRMDEGPSAVSKMLNKQEDKDNQRNFPLAKLEDVLDETGDLDPIFYLIEKYCVDNEVKKKQAIAQIPAIIDQLQDILRQAREG
jgi:hypothetical protein